MGISARGAVRAARTRAEQRLTPYRTRRFSTLTLPPPDIRLGGAHFLDDRTFVQSGMADVRRLERAFGLAAGDVVLDIGCGVGRLAIGVVATENAAEYVGMDVAKDSIAWCRRNIQRHHPALRFVHLDVANARYQPDGRAIDDSYRLPLPDASVAVIHLYSVFSHMEADDVRRYLREFRRLLRPDGGVFLTAFLEDGVEDVAINPAGYGPLKWDGALHAVRFSRAFFERLVDDAGLSISRLDPHTETDEQSAVYLVRSHQGAPHAATASREPSSSQAPAPGR